VKFRCAKHHVAGCHPCALLPPGVAIWELDPEALPDTNPKTAVGAKKVPLHLIPPAAKHVLAEAMADGAKKYGPFNWRETGVTASTYVSAAQRHIDAWWDGEDLSPDALVHHLGHAMACMAILIDVISLGKLNDDRPAKGAAPRLQAEFVAKAKAPVARIASDDVLRQARAELEQVDGLAGFPLSDDAE